MNNLLSFTPSQKLTNLFYKLSHQTNSFLNRNQLSLSSIIMPLGQKQLDCLRKQFCQFHNSAKGLNLVQFIKLLRQLLPHQRKQEFQLIQGIIKLFKLADYQQTGYLLWKDFTNFLSEEAINYLTTMPDYQDITVKQNLQLKIIAIDKSVHSNYIVQIHIYNNLIYTLDRLSHDLRIFNFQGIQQPKKEIIESINKKQSCSQYILDFALNSNIKTLSYHGIIIAITNTKKFIVLINQKNQFKQYTYFYHSYLHVKIVYLPIHNLWATASSQHQIFFWNFSPNFLNQQVSISAHKKKIKSSYKLIQQALVASFVDHIDNVTSIVQLKQPRCIATGSMDCIIKLWDVQRKKLIIDLTQGQQRLLCVCGLDYSQASGHYMLSYGFRSTVTLWCPFKSRTRAYIGKLQGHKYNIICSRFVEKKPCCVSIDQKNFIKLWDTRTLSVLVSLSATNKKNTLTIQNSYINTLVAVKDKIILAGKRLYIFKHQSISKNKIKQGSANIDMMIILSKQKFVVLKRTQVLFYSGDNGQLLSIKRFSLGQGERFTCMVQSCRYNHLILSDSSGMIYYLEYKQLIEQPIFQLKKGKYSVQKFIYNDINYLIFWSYNYLYILLQDKHQLQITTQMPILQQSRCISLTLSQQHHLIALLSSQSLIKFYYLTSCKQGPSYKMKNKSFKVYFVPNSNTLLISQQSFISILYIQQDITVKYKIKLFDEQAFEFYNAVTMICPQQFYSDIIDYIMIADNQGNIRTLKIGYLLNKFSHFQLQNFQLCQFNKPKVIQSSQLQIKCWKQLTKSNFVGAKIIDTNKQLFFTKDSGFILSMNQILGVIQQPGSISVIRWQYSPNNLYIKIKEMLQSIQIMASINKTKFTNQQIQQIIISHLGELQQEISQGDKTNAYTVKMQSILGTSHYQSKSNIEQASQSQSGKHQIIIPAVKQSQQQCLNKLKDTITRCKKSKNLQDRINYRLSRNIVLQMNSYLKQPAQEEIKKQKVQYKRKATIVKDQNRQTKQKVIYKQTQINQQKKFQSEIKTLSKKFLNQMYSKINLYQEDDFQTCNFSKPKHHKRKFVQQAQTAVSNAIFQQSLTYSSKSSLRPFSPNSNYKQISKLYSFNSLQRGKRFRLSDNYIKFKNIKIN